MSFTKTVIKTITETSRKAKDFYRRITNNKKLGAFWDKVAYFMGNFWPYIIGIMSVMILVRLRILYNRNFRSSEITKFVKNSKHAGNAVFINKGFLITNYKSLATACRVTKTTENVRAFIIFNGEAIRVEIVAADEGVGLTLLRLDPNERRNINVNNFVLFPDVSDSNYQYIGSSVFISKMINDPDSDVYKDYKITGVDVGGYTVKNKDVFRKNFGE
ncbi:MAG: hypothetical protein LBI29_04635, partial [Rickettsiales bacterium]|nr:hypothetical protein [Rickettsiales bacterium]